MQLDRDWPKKDAPALHCLGRHHVGTGGERKGHSGGGGAKFLQNLHRFIVAFIVFVLFVLFCQWTPVTPPPHTPNNRRGYGAPGNQKTGIQKFE